MEIKLEYLIIVIAVLIVVNVIVFLITRKPKNVPETDELETDSSPDGEDYQGLLDERDRLEEDLQNARKTHDEYVESLAGHYNKLVTAYKWYRDGYSSLRVKNEELYEAYSRERNNREKTHSDAILLERELAQAMEKQHVIEKKLIEAQNVYNEFRKQVMAESEKHAEGQGDHESLVAELKTIKKAFDNEKQQHEDELNAIKVELDAEKEYKGKVDKLEAEKQDLAMQLEVLRGKMTELDETKKENDQIRQQLEDYQRLQDTISKMAEENAALRAKGIVIEKPPKHETVQMTSGLIGFLNQLLANISKEGNYRGAVVADEIGLPVAGQGESVDGLAGAAAVFSEINERIHGLIPFGTIKALSANDDNGLTLTVQPLHVLSDPLLLAMLTVGPPPEIKMPETLKK